VLQLRRDRPVLQRSFAIIDDRWDLPHRPNHLLPATPSTPRPSAPSSSLVDVASLVLGTSRRPSFSVAPRPLDYAFRDVGACFFSRLERVSIGLAQVEDRRSLNVREVMSDGPLRGQMEAIVREGCSGWIRQKLVVQFDMEASVGVLKEKCPLSCPLG
jgi:hypothetical protein